MRRQRTPESEFRTIWTYTRAISDEGRPKLSESYYGQAEAYDRLAAVYAAQRAACDGTPGRKRSLARSANSFARQATIARATARAYAMQLGPVEPVGVRKEITA